jgi:hypothetical protein
MKMEKHQGAKVWRRIPWVLNASFQSKMELICVNFVQLSLKLGSNNIQSLELRLPSSYLKETSSSYVHTILVEGGKSPFTSYFRSKILCLKDKITK